MRYRFGGRTLDSEKRELLHGGALQNVEPQVFDLIVFLIEERQRVVSRDEIIEAVWKGRIVSDSAISSRIKTARQVLGDDGRAQAVIKTVHGKGFRFVAEVSEGLMPHEAPPAISQPQSIEPTNTPGSSVLIPGALLVSAVAALVLFFQLAPLGKDADQARIAILPVANQTGDESLQWAELGLMSLVAHDLKARSELPVIKSSTVMTLTERFPSFIEDDLLPSEQVRAALAEGYGVSHILVSRLTGPPDNLTLEYRMINPRGETVPASISGEMAAAMATEMSRRIAAALPRSGERTDAVDDQVFGDAFVAETYARGRALQMQGLGQEAADMFRVATAQAPENLQLRYELAVSTRLAGDLGNAEEQFGVLIADAANIGDRDIQAAALNGLGVVHLVRRHNEPALNAFEEALTVLGERGDAEMRGVILTNVGIIKRRQRAFVEAEEALGRAVVAFDRAGYEGTPSTLLNSLALLKVQMRDVPTANQYLDQALKQARIVGDRRSEATVLHNIGTNWIQVGAYEKGSALLLDALKMRMAMDDLPGQMSSYASLAQAAVNVGDADAASVHVEAMIDLADAADDDYHRARALALASHLALVRSQWREAEQHSAQAEELFDGLSRGRNARREQVRQAVARGYSGSVEEHEVVEGVLNWAIKGDQQGTELVCYEALTVLDLLNRDYASASQYIDDAVRLSADMHLNTVTGRLAARQGLVRLMQGNVTGATASLGRAKTGYREHHETLLLEALLARQAGELEKAADLQAKAKEVAGDNWSLSERLFAEAFDKS